MGYYMRYISTHSPSVTVPTITDALVKHDSQFKVRQSPIESTRAELLYADQLLGELEINLPDDDIFEEDLEELHDLVEGIGDPSEKRVLDTLNDAKFIVAVSATWDGKESADVFSKLDILWNWLFANYSGLLQADNEGFYDSTDLILELHLKI